MAAKATRCPHCQTSFRVTEAQLKTARGLVRCGACLEVFNAAEHWLESEETNNQNVDANESGTKSGADDDILFDDDNGLPDEDQHQLQHARPYQEQSEQKVQVSPGRNEALRETITHSETEPADADERHANSERSERSEQLTVDETEAARLAMPAPDSGSSQTKADDDAFEQLVYQGKQRLRISRQQLGWSLLSVLAALGLAAQIVYANFNQIAQSAYRPQLLSVCKAVNFIAHGQYCTMPPPQNLALIRSRGLNIYSHPKYENSLLIDALIVNQAVFEQPFPIIELEFHNQSDRRIASRRFTPDEYLAGELKGLEFMPSQQTIHINISILDPGETAVNYQMHFHPADRSS